MGDEIVFTHHQSTAGPPENPNVSIRVRVAKPTDAKLLIKLVNGLMQDGQNYLSDSLPYTLEQQTEYLQQSGEDHVILPDFCKLVRRKFAQKK